MSRLKLYFGDETARRTAVCQADDPPILNYKSHAGRWQRFRNDPLDRARTLRRNDRCPHCCRALVKPLELADALRSRNNLPIPGTATLVGFHCESCHWEWPA